MTHLFKARLHCKKISAAVCQKTKRKIQTVRGVYIDLPLCQIQPVEFDCLQLIYRISSKEVA